MGRFRTLFQIAESEARPFSSFGFNRLRTGLTTQRQTHYAQVQGEMATSDFGAPSGYALADAHALIVAANHAKITCIDKPFGREAVRLAIEGMFAKVPDPGTSRRPVGRDVG